MKPTRTASPFLFLILAVLAMVAIPISGIFAGGEALAQAPPATGTALNGKEITDGQRYHIRELEARLLQVDNQVKDWQLTGRPEAQKQIQQAYQEAQATCKTGQQLDTTTLTCVNAPKAPEAPPAAPAKTDGKK